MKGTGMIFALLANAAPTSKLPESIEELGIYVVMALIAGNVAQWVAAHRMRSKFEAALISEIEKRGELLIELKKEMQFMRQTGGQ